MIEKGRIRGRKNFTNAQVRVLLDPAGSFSPRKSTGKESSSSILLQEVIFLPCLESPVSELATFSSAPTTLDCFVFVPYLRNCNEIWINIYSHADKTWKTHDLAANDHPLGALKAIGYMEGTFYCHFAGQELSLVMTTCPALDHLDDSLFNYLS